MDSIREMIITTFDKIQAEGFIEKEIEKNLQNTISEILKSSLREYSDFGKELKKAIEKSINLNITELNLPEYNQLILNAIKAKLSELMHEEGVKKVEEDIEKLLSPERKDWKLSEFIDVLKKEYEDEARENEWDEISFHINPDRSVLTHIYIDPEPDKKSHECEIRLCIDRDDSIFSADYGGRKFNKGLITDRLRGTEKLLFKLFAQKCKFIVDEDDVELGYDREYDD